MSRMTPIREASLEVAVIYYNIIFSKICVIKANQIDVPDDLSKILDMCNIIMDTNVEMYDDKVSRWLGFVQGAMYSYGLLDINTERDRTRPLFHDAYEKMGLPIPASINIEEM